MREKRVGACAIALAIGAAIIARADETFVEDPGWTGLTKPEDVILARRELMIEAQSLMRPIDALVAGEPTDDGEVRSAAQTIHHLMLAVPHLFPPTTNRYDPDAAEPRTLALPAIWQSFDAFYAQAIGTSDAAATLAEAPDGAGLSSAAIGLRAACDACHAPYMRPYVAATVTEEDLEFDFDSVFE